MHRYKKQRLYFLLMKPFQKIKARFYKYGFYVLLIVVILQALIEGMLS